MIDHLLASLKQDITPELTGKFNLNPDQITKTIDITSTSLTEVVKNHANSNISGMLNLFSSEENNESGNTILENLKTTLSSNLSSRLNLDNQNANALATYILPFITKYITERVSGNSNNLLSMFENSDLINDLAGGLMKDKIKGLFN